jgi:hypothetical protein
MSKLYLVKYYFNGYGRIEIEANSKDEAEAKFWDGDYDEDEEDEWGDDYEVDEINEIK